MTVRELIEELKQLDQYKEIKYYSHNTEDDEDISSAGLVTTPTEKYYRII